MKRFSRRKILKATVVSAGTLGGINLPKRAKSQFSWMKQPVPNTPSGPRRLPFDTNNPAIIYHPRNCERCGDCVSICRDVQTVFDHTGNFPANEVPCIHCGQCTANCWSNAVTERFELQPLYSALMENKQSSRKKKFVALVAPSVRVTLGEMFKMPPGTNVEKQTVSALRKLGFDYVFDVTFSADLTVIEEAAELEARLNKKHSGDGSQMPLFTSCCPAWVKFARLFYPQLLPHISSCKSPIMMHGAVIKTWFAGQNGLKPEDIVTVAITPCTAKKYERTLGTMNEIDFALTTRELGWWMMEFNLDPKTLEEGEFDSTLGNGSGAGDIFGNTGGVTEAVLRQVYFDLEGKEAPKDFLALSPIRGMDGVRQAEVKIGNKSLRVAVVHGTASARRLLDSPNFSSMNLDFVEVMACRGGCVGGGGLPKTQIPISDELKAQRIQGLYASDQKHQIRRSGANPEIQKLYELFLKKTGNEILHTQRKG
ncbi:MAG: hydrogenase [Planctomycetaceae bacterium]|nr:hydrogenase [Planctomycetaceae bacterium]